MFKHPIDTTDATEHDGRPEVALDNQRFAISRVETFTDDGHGRGLIVADFVFHPISHRGHE